MSNAADGLDVGAAGFCALINRFIWSCPRIKVAYGLQIKYKAILTLIIVMYY